MFNELIYHIICYQFGAEGGLSYTRKAGLYSMSGSTNRDSFPLSVTHKTSLIKCQSYPISNTMENALSKIQLRPTSSGNKAPPFPYP